MTTSKSKVGEKEYKMTRKEAIEEVNRLNGVAGIAAWSNMEVAIEKRKMARKIAKQYKISNLIIWH